MQIPRSIPLVAGALGLAALLLLANTISEAPRAAAAGPAPAMQDPAGGEDEKHGGEIVFRVESKSQKYSVLFSHEEHLAADLKCDNCHESIFKKEIEQNHFKMADINKGKACGVCHQAEPPAGVRASFPPKKNCDRCHTLRVRAPEKAQR